MVVVDYCSLLFLESNFLNSESLTKNNGRIYSKAPHGKVEYAAGEIVRAFPYRGEHMHACMILPPHGDVSIIITKFENLN